jgi:hypothetical protein
MEFAEFNQSILETEYQLCLEVMKILLKELEGRKVMRL